MCIWLPYPPRHRSDAAARSPGPRRRGRSALGSGHVGARPGPRRRLRCPVRPADRPAGARGEGLLRDRAAHDAGRRDAGPGAEGDRAVRRSVVGLRARRPGARRGALRRRRRGLRHVLRLPGDGPVARRRGLADRRPRVRPHSGRRGRARHAAGRPARAAQRLDVPRRLGDRGTRGLHAAGLDGRHAGGGVRGRRSRLGRRAVAPRGAAHRARPAGARALPPRDRRLPADLDDAQHRRRAGRGRSASRSATAARSARCPAASTPPWPPRSCSARSATG